MEVQRSIDPKQYRFSYVCHASRRERAVKGAFSANRSNPGHGGQKMWSSTQKQLEHAEQSHASRLVTCAR